MTPDQVAHLLRGGEEPWQKNRRMLQRGYGDLVYLPKSRTGWNTTLAALAFSQRPNRAGDADLNEWAVMHGCPGSARYAELGNRALVLWHGTSDEWLTGSITRILRRLDEATAVEVFSSLYATLDPWRALEHEVILTRLEELCTARRTASRSIRFSLA